MEDNKTVALLYQAYAHKLFKYLLAKLQIREEAEDLMVEVFLAALQYKGLPGLSERQQFSWLLAVTRNKLADWHRKNMRTPRISLEQHNPLLLELLAEADIPEIAIIKREESALLQQHISALPPLQQEILHLRFILGLRHAEIASLLGKREGAIQAAFLRAIRSLRAIYQQETRSEMHYEPKK